MLFRSAIFGQSKPLIQIDTGADIVLPNGASFTDASPELTFQDENADSDVIASLSYTYNGEPVGTADILSLIHISSPAGPCRRRCRCG